MKDYARYSYWLDTCGDDLTPRAPLDGSIAVDVGILGAGFTGLWTAYHLLKRDPSLKVAVVEAEIAGFGASGRNGGWCFSGFPMPIAKLRQNWGDDAARAVMRQMYTAVDNVGQVCREEGIDAHYAKSGTLEIARAPHHLPHLLQMYREYQELGLADHYALLDVEGTAEHLRVAGMEGALLLKEGATVHPARLARGLAHAVERHGGTIYEQTRVTDFTPGPGPTLITERGNVAARVIVLAGEAYLSQLPQLRRQIMPMTSHLVITEPLGDAIWQEIGWERREVIGSSGTMSGYLNKTVDGRIAFGPYRGVYPYGSRISDALDRQEAIFAHGRAAALDWFPMIRGARFTHAWGGVFGIPRDRMPTMSYDPRTGIATGRGYTGEGVATANLSGRVLADLITGADSELTHLPMTAHRSPDWEPEPLRWLGVNAVRKSLARVERQAEQTGRYPDKPTLAQRIWRR
ncbi:MAG TPA: FAD-dependent oxidoreductase [Thermomicrobiaceae bacterium]|nr:FAD-dependent oxidoreductase [Thermomicrobiaceae bacterium]